MDKKYAKINDALNAQMNKEFFSSYTYLAVASHFENEELPGFANFFKIQAREELVHAMKIFDFLHRIGGKTELGPIAAPKIKIEKPLDAFSFGLKNEMDLAEDINNILNLSVELKHPPTRVFIFWFVEEQVEEEALFNRCVKRIERVGQDGQGLLALDREFAERAPATGGGKSDDAD